jgi:hypothetical protein
MAEFVINELEKLRNVAVLAESDVMARKLPRKAERTKKTFVTKFFSQTDSRNV